MTHKSRHNPLTIEQQDASKTLLEKSGPVIVASDTTHRLTLNLSLDSKRKAHAMALAANCSVSSVIESLIIKCTETPNRPSSIKNKP
jgi:hypothetical protein